MVSKLGRPRKILDEEKITQLVGKGFTVEFVADFMAVHVDTLYANYSEALRKGYAFRNGCLQARQFQNAMAKNNTTMQIWLGKQWLGQKDRTDLTTGDRPFKIINEFVNGNTIPLATQTGASQEPN